MGRTQVRIGHLSTVYHTAFILMGTDLLHKRGIRAGWKLYASGPDIIRAMEAGIIDLAYIGIPPFIIGLDRGLRATCVAGGHIEGTVMIARPEIRPLVQFSGMREFLSQFEGLSIGCPPRGSIHDIIIRDLVSRYSIRSMTVRNYAWADFLHDALDEGEIVAAVGTPALAVATRRYGCADIVVPPDQLWPYNPSYGLVARETLLSDPILLTGIISAHEEASEMIRHEPERCARIVADQTGFVDEPYMMDAYQISPHYCASLPSEYVASAMAFSHTLHELGSTSRVIGMDEIFDTSYIEVIHPANPHYRGPIDYLSRGQ